MSVCKVKGCKHVLSSLSACSRQVITMAWTTTKKHKRYNWLKLEELKVPRYYISTYEPKIIYQFMGTFKDLYMFIVHVEGVNSPDLLCVDGNTELKSFTKFREIENEYHINYDYRAKPKVQESNKELCKLGDPHIETGKELSKDIIKGCR